MKKKKKVLIAQGNSQQSYSEHDTNKVIILHTGVWRKECLTLMRGIFPRAILLLALTGKSCNAEVKFTMSVCSHNVQRTDDEANKDEAHRMVEY